MCPKSSEVNFQLQVGNGAGKSEDWKNSKLNTIGLINNQNSDNYKNHGYTRSGLLNHKDEITSMGECDDKPHHNDESSDDRLAGGDESDESTDSNSYHVRSKTAEHYAGELNQICVNCSAMHFKDEAHRRRMYKSCCHFGKLAYTPRDSYPEYLRSLFTDTASSDHKNFKANIRSYNSALSFASMGANVEQFTRGVYFFKVHGQVYHNTYNINPLENTNRRYSQLYVIDTNDATDLRSRNPANEKCDRAILHNLGNTIREVNPYAESC